MACPERNVNIFIDGVQTYQKIDGFGVNINARCFEPRLMPAMHLLRYDLGATLYRVDIWGKSDWLDPTGAVGKSALEPDFQARFYEGDIFNRGWAMMHWLNQQGAQPYLTASGIVPPWMLGPDGKTLADFDSFTAMMVEMLDWAKKREKLDFHLFGPLNETDLGPSEGPLVSPADYVQVCEMLVDKLDARGLSDIRLVVAEQAQFNPNYLQALVCSSKLLGRIAAFGLHDYSDIPSEQFAEVSGVVKDSPFNGIPLWMTEYGDLEQSGEREWYVAWAMTSRLFDQLQAGFSASLAWDAYDNYHDHDEYWTIYGLLRTELRIHTPKKRYYACKQIFRYVLPGFDRIHVESGAPELRVLAFASPNRDQFTLVGMNKSEQPLRLNIQVQGLNIAGMVTYYRTSENENCHQIGSIPLRGANWPFNGIDVTVPPACIFTLTT